MTASLHMRPPLSVHYFGDRFAANTVSLRNVFMPNTLGGKRADFTHRLLGKLGRSALLAPRKLIQLLIYRVLAILNAGHPLKIIDAIVELVAVLVVHLRLVLRVRNEGFRNEAVNRSAVGSALFAHRHSEVADRLDPAFDDVAANRLFRSPTASNNAIDRAGAAQAGHLVEALKSDDVAPFFHMVPDYINGQRTGQEQ